MPSHRAVASSASEMEKRWNEGNDHADKAAGTRREEIEAELDSDLRQAVADRCNLAVKALKLAGTLLAFCPRCPEPLRGGVSRARDHWPSTMTLLSSRRVATGAAGSVESSARACSRKARPKVLAHAGRAGSLSR